MATIFAVLSGIDFLSVSLGEFNRWMHQLRFFHIPAPRF